MDQKYIFRVSSNWADEIDIDGHYIINQTELDDLKSALNYLKNNKDWEFSVYIGTNEHIEYRGDDGYYYSIHNDVSWEAITQSEYECLERLKLLDSGFGSNYYHTIIDFWKI